jgi:hypothetical protein
MEPPAACVAAAAAADADVFGAALAGLPDELLAGLDDPPHAASRGQQGGGRRGGAGHGLRPDSVVREVTRATAAAHGL